MTGIVCIPRAVGFVTVGLLAHIHALVRVPTFVMGHVLGQVMLRSELTERDERTVAICTDVGAFVILVMSVTPIASVALIFLMIFAGEPFIAFMGEMLLLVPFIVGGPSHHHHHHHHHYHHHHVNMFTRPVCWLDPIPRKDSGGFSGSSWRPISFFFTFSLLCKFLESIRGKEYLWILNVQKV